MAGRVMASDYWGTGFDCPRCDRHYYANLPRDGSPVSFICIDLCGYVGTAALDIEHLGVVFTPAEPDKEATDDQS
jgi:hypothetical protein